MRIEPALRATPSGRQTANDVHIVLRSSHRAASPLAALNEERNETEKMPRALVKKRTGFEAAV